MQVVKSIHKSQLGIYTLAMSNTKNEIKKTIRFTIALKRYKGINSAKEVQNLHSAQYKILLKDRNK